MDMDLVDSDPKYKSLSREAVQTISVCANVDFKIPEEEELIDMCKAIEDMKDDARNEGRIEGRREGHLEGFAESQSQMAMKMLKKNEPVEKIIEYTSLSDQQVQELAQQMQ